MVTAYATAAAAAAAEAHYQAMQLGHHRNTPGTASLSGLDWAASKLISTTITPLPARRSAWCSITPPAEPVVLPGLLLGAAVGRALIDEASVPVQILVLGIPVAALLPLRSWFYRNQLWWQVLAAALFAVAIPKLVGLCGVWFDQPSASAALDWWRVAWTALLGPLLLWPLRLLPPLRAFVERGR